MKRTYPTWLGPNKYSNADKTLEKTMGGFRNTVTRRKRLVTRWRLLASRGYPRSVGTDLSENATRVMQGEIKVSVCVYLAFVSLTHLCLGDLSRGFHNTKVYGLHQV